MNTKTATAPAWQVRELARQRLLEGIQQRFIRREHHFWGSTLYSILLFLLERQLTCSKSVISTNDFPEIPWDEKHQIFNLFCKVVKEIRGFQRSSSEGYALFAKLLEWTAGELARPHHWALQKQEVHEPKRIFRANSATDPIPIE